MSAYGGSGGLPPSARQGHDLAGEKVPGTIFEQPAPGAVTATQQALDALPEGARVRIAGYGEVSRDELAQWVEKRVVIYREGAWHLVHGGGSGEVGGPGGLLPSGGRGQTEAKREARKAIVHELNLLYHD